LKLYLEQADKNAPVMPSLARHLLFLVEKEQKEIPRFALHHTVRGFARDDIGRGLFHQLASLDSRGKPFVPVSCRTVAWMPSRQRERRIKSQ